MYEKVDVVEGVIQCQGSQMSLFLLSESLVVVLPESEGLSLVDSPAGPRFFGLMMMEIDSFPVCLGKMCSLTSEERSCQ